MRNVPLALRREGKTSLHEGEACRCTLRKNLRAAPMHVAACQAGAERTWRIHFLTGGREADKG